MKADIEALKRIAEAATGGPWVVWSSLYEGMAAAVVHDVEPLETVAEFRAYRNAVFLAAFDPPTCLALLSELASLRSEREGMREGLKPFADVIDEAEAEYRRRGGDPRIIPDNTPLFDIAPSRVEGGKPFWPVEQKVMALVGTFRRARALTTRRKRHDRSPIPRAGAVGSGRRASGRADVAHPV